MSSSSSSADGAGRSAPTAADYVHAFLLRFNAPLFTVAALASMAFTPRLRFSFFQSVYAHAWYLVPALWYTNDVGATYYSYKAGVASGTAAAGPAKPPAPPKTIGQIAWRNVVNVSYMSSVMFWASVVRGDVDLATYVPAFVSNACVDAYNAVPATWARPFLFMTSAWTAMYVVHYVGFAWFSQLPDHVRRIAANLRRSAENLALARDAAAHSQ